MMKLKAALGFILIVSVIFSNSIFAQKIFTVVYKYKQVKQMGDSFYFDILTPARSVYQMQAEKRKISLKAFKFQKSDSGFNESICSFEVYDTTCDIIWDGFGYESFIIPGDTIEIYLEKKQQEEGHYWVNKDKNYQSVWFYNYSFTGRNRYIYSLFDSLAYFSNTLQFGFINLQMAELHLDTFFRMATERYRSRVEYLYRYCKLYNIPESIRQLAYSEIRSAYIINL